MLCVWFYLFTAKARLTRTNTSKSYIITMYLQAPNGVVARVTDFITHPAQTKSSGLAFGTDCTQACGWNCFVYFVHITASPTASVYSLSLPVTSIEHLSTVKSVASARLACKKMIVMVHIITHCRYKGTVVFLYSVVLEKLWLLEFTTNPFLVKFTWL